MVHPRRSTRILSSYYRNVQSPNSDNLRNLAQGRGRRTDKFNFLPLYRNWVSRFKMRPVVLILRSWNQSLHKAGNINELSSCASPYDFHRWRTPPRSDGRQRLCDRSLTRATTPGSLRYHALPQASSFWRLLVANQKIKCMCRAVGRSKAIASQKGTQGGSV